MAVYNNGVLVPVAPAAHEGTHVSGGSDDIDSALVDAAIPSLATSKITSTRFPVDRLPAMTDEKIWKGTGANVEEIDVPAGAPSGLIALWHGTIANIPAGWVICDGNNSTPNLLTKFVQGVATAATDPGATGGATAKTTSGHQHDLPWGFQGYYDYDEFGVGADISADFYHAELSNSLARAAAMAKSNTDGIADIRPLFYDVAFLMKT